MCCFFTVLVLLGPRFAILIWYLFQPLRFQATFDTWIVPLATAIFLPWTMLMYVLVFPGGITGFDWVWLGLALVADIASYAGGGYGNRNRIPGASG
jgi:hypothetical protein